MRPTSVRTVLIAALLGAAATPAGAQADADAPPSVERPSYRFLRFTEDWSVLADGEPADTDWTDAIKYVPLTEDGEVWASFGGSARARLEAWRDFAFGAPADPDDEFLLWRARVHGDLHVGENLRFFVEGKSAGSTERDLPGGRRALDVDSVALEQAFVDLILPIGDEMTLTLRPGRQQFLFGKQRLVSPLPWANTLRRWDGVSGILHAGDLRVHGFWSQFAPVQKYRFNDPDAQTQFYGVYATGSIGGGGPGLDLYALGLSKDDDVTFNGTTGPEDRYTIGARVFDSLGPSGFDYDLEAAYQFGEVGAGDVSAWMVGSEVGYRFAGEGAMPRVSLGFDAGSGDDETGGDVGTFNQLFPLGHAYLGYADFVGRQNVLAANAKIAFTPLEKMTVTVAGHAFWRAEDTDALYNAGGGVVRPGSGGTSSEVGQEIDVTVKYRFDRHLTGLFGYSHFFAGDFIEESGASDDIDFLYVQLQYTF